MNIFVLVERAFEDVTDVIGAFSSLEKAQEKAQAKSGNDFGWKDDTEGVLCSTAPGQQDGCFLIYKLELDV